MKRNKLQGFWADTDGATAIEYALIVALIVGVAVVAFPSMAGWVGVIVTHTADAIGSS